MLSCNLGETRTQKIQFISTRNHIWIINRNVEVLFLLTSIKLLSWILLTWTNIVMKSLVTFSSLPGTWFSFNQLFTWHWKTYNFQICLRALETLNLFVPSPSMATDVQDVVSDCEIDTSLSLIFLKYYLYHLQFL